MVGDAQGKLDPTEVARQYDELAEPLRRFLLTILRDRSLVQDVMQTAFAKLVEQGADVERSCYRAWVFRVAYNEAMLHLRRGKVHAHAIRRWAGNRVSPHGDDDVSASVLHAETIGAVRRAIEQLPEPQQQVLRMRVYENKTFAEIAKQLGLPLGTVLSRMHSALAKLRRQLDQRQ